MHRRCAHLAGKSLWTKALKALFFSFPRMNLKEIICSRSGSTHVAAEMVAVVTEDKDLHLWFQRASSYHLGKFKCKQKWVQGGAATYTSCFFFFLTFTSNALRCELHTLFFQVFTTTPGVRIHPRHTQRHLARLVQSTICNHKNHPLYWAVSCVPYLFTSATLL